MKIAAKGVSKLTDQELKVKLLEMPPVDDVKKYLQEANNRWHPGEAKASEIFEIASRDPKVVDDLLALMQILNYLSKSLRYENSENILKTLLNHPPEYFDIGGVKKTLSGILSSSPNNTSMGLLLRGTPTDIIYDIIDKYHLNIPSKAKFIERVPSEEYAPNVSDQILINILSDLKSGMKWDNKDSGTLLTTRLIQNTHDKFITEVSKYNLNPSFASALLNASDRVNNPQLKENISSNSMPGIEVAKIFNNRTDPFETIPKLIMILMKNEVDDNLIWDGIANKINIGEWSVRELFGIEHNNSTIVELMSKNVDGKTSDIVDMLVKHVNQVGYIDISGMSTVEDFIHRCINESSLKDKILQLPYDLFNKIRMTPQDREIVDSYYQKDIPQINDDALDMYKNIMGNRNGWYQKYSKSS